MSLDYPIYEKIKTRSRWLGILWQLGDIGYYLGILGVLAIVPYSLAKREGGERPYASAGLKVFGACLVIFVLSILAKSYVHKRSRKLWPEIYVSEIK